MSDNGHDPDAPPIVAPQPCPVTFALNIGRFPNGLKGETTDLVMVDVYKVTGQDRLFLTADGAISLARQLLAVGRACTHKLRVADATEIAAVRRVTDADVRRLN